MLWLKTCLWLIFYYVVDMLNNRSYIEFANPNISPTKISKTECWMFFVWPIGALTYKLQSVNKNNKERIVNNNYFLNIIFYWIFEGEVAVQIHLSVVQRWQMLNSFNTSITLSAYKLQFNLLHNNWSLVFFNFPLFIYDP